MDDLKNKTLTSGLAKAWTQAVASALRLGSLVIFARLLEPRDFGLVAMVTAVTGVFSLLRDFGLSAAAVQRANISAKQMSTLFWINIAGGALLGALLLVSAPFVARFYHEPALFWITIVLSAGFVFSAAGVQHATLLQRDMRFTAIAAIDLASLATGTAAGVVMALAGLRHWALIATTILQPVISTILLFAVTKWIPGKPGRLSDVTPLLRFGTTITLNGGLVYLASNLDKVLLGRYMGAEATGIYGRAYQLASVPMDSLNSAVGSVAFSALSRLQDEPLRLQTYFLKGYSLILALTLPISAIGALFADDIVTVVLGPKWTSVATLFRILAPTIVVFAMINPLAWLLFALGMVRRSLNVALVLAPLVSASYLIGLPYGPTGVATAYSTTMLLWLVPHVLWCLRDTPIRPAELWRVIQPPLYSCLGAAAVAVAMRLLTGSKLGPLPRLGTEVTALLTGYVTLLLWVMGQGHFYFELIKSVRRRSSPDEPVLLSA